MFLIIFHNFGNARIRIEFIVGSNPGMNEKIWLDVGEMVSPGLNLHKEASVWIECSFDQFR